MMRSLIAGLLWAAIAATSVENVHAASEYITARQFLDMYDAGGRGKADALAMLYGAHEGLSWANAFLTEKKRSDALYCPPDRLAITDDQAMAILKSATEHDKKLFLFPWGFAFLKAMQSTFPCDE